MNTQSEPQLVRGIGLVQATSANMLNMIGIGPFITIYLILQSMGGPQALLGWVLGALIAICDGLVWAELGAAMPGSGGPYHYLQKAYGPLRLGRMMSFLYIWQTAVCAPLSVASGAVGFREYALYLFPNLTDWQVKAVAVGMCLLVTILLYRNIKSVGKLSVALLAVVVSTTLWIVISGFIRFDTKLALDFPADAFSFSTGFFMGLGSATLLAMYSYGGYFNVCLVGGEVKDPGRTIPRSILLAIVTIAIIYMAMSIGIIGVIPWGEAMQSKFVVSIFMERIYGSWAGVLVTLLILFASFGSVFAIMLGYSRVPYAAAVEGRFFAIFGKVHPTQKFPHVSLLIISGCSMVACFLDLSEIISALMVIQVIIIFMAQVVAVTLMRRYRKDILRPFKMWFYPIPSIVAFLGWVYILISSGGTYVLMGLSLLIGGILAYLFRARIVGEKPFVKEMS